MQAVSGAYLTDLSGVAQLPSIDMAMNQGLHSFLRKIFAPQIQMMAGSIERRRGVLGCCSRAPLANGFGVRTIECQTGAALVCSFCKYDD